MPNQETPKLKSQLAGVRFDGTGPLYFFDSNGLNLEIGTLVIVDRGKGTEAAQVVIAPGQVELYLFKGLFPPVLDLVGVANISQIQSSPFFRKALFIICNQLLKEAGRFFELLDVEFSPESNSGQIYLVGNSRQGLEPFSKELGALLNSKIEFWLVQGEQEEAGEGTGILNPPGGFRGNLQINPFNPVKNFNPRLYSQPYFKPGFDTSKLYPVPGERIAFFKEDLELTGFSSVTGYKELESKLKGGAVLVELYQPVEDQTNG